MPLVEYPPELTKNHWDRRKDAIPKGCALESALQALQKKHLAVDWSLFEEDSGATESLAGARKAEEAQAAAYRDRVMPLKTESSKVKGAAEALQAGAAKATQDAIKQILAAVKSYGQAITAGPAELEQRHARTIKELDAADAADEDVSAMLDPKRLLKMLQRCAANPETTLNFALVDGSDASDPAMVMNPRISGTSLFASLKKETGGKTGAHGLARVRGKDLILQVDKTVPGLAKKARTLVKNARFAIGRIVLADLSGAVLEADEEAPEVPPAEASAPVESAEQVEARRRLEALEPLLQAALRANHPDASKLRAAAAFVQEKMEQGNFAAALKALAGMEGRLVVPPSDPMADFKARGNGLIPRIKAAVAAGLPGADGLRAKMTEANGLAQQKDFAGATRVLDEVEAALTDDEGIDPATALQNYEKARTEVVARLKRLSRAVRASGHSQADKALIEIQAVLANLSPRPETLAAAQEVERYLETDDVVADVDGPNPFGIEILLQQTLLGPVYDLTASLS